MIMVHGACIVEFNSFWSGLLTTPQLHFIVKSCNSQGSYGQPDPLGYYRKLSTAFRSLMSQVLTKNLIRIHVHVHEP